MSERYTRLFALEENLYSDGSPVVISAGALLKDNQTGAVLAQLKIRNIGGKTIKAAAVRITCFDTVGKPLEGTAEKEYLDLTAGRDEEFGQKSLVSLPDTSARSFSVAVTWVAFSDNTVWNASEEELSALPKQDSLSEVFGDEELVKQYRLKYGAGTKSFPRKYKDLWFCACGAFNHADEEVCHVCGQKLAALLPFDAEALKAEKDKRLQKEADERRRAEEQANAAAAESAKKAKKARKTAAIVAAAICGCAVVAVLLYKIVIPSYKLNQADKLAASGNYEAAFMLLDELNYKNSEEKRERILQTTKREDVGLYYKLLFNETNVNDTLSFGSYEQDGNASNGKENIEWILLTKENEKALLISRYALDCQPYTTKWEEITWEACTLRKWLNNEFFNAAFSDEEKSMIITAAVAADMNPKNGTKPGADTKDKVFLLSIVEVENYFGSDSERECSPTTYAKSNGVYVANNGNCWWWLRSPGYLQSDAANVGSNGGVGYNGNYVNYETNAVRPAMWIDLNN